MMFSARKLRAMSDDELTDLARSLLTEQLRREHIVTREALEKIHRETQEHVKTLRALLDTSSPHRPKERN